MTKSTLKPVAEKLRRSRGRTGVIYTWSDGRRIFLANKRIKDISFKGEKTISDAVRAGTACWALDDETLYDIRAKGITVVGIKDRDTGDIWLTHLINFLDREKTLHISTWSGMSWRNLPFKFFRRRPGRVRV